MIWVKLPICETGKTWSLLSRVILDESNSKNKNQQNAKVD